MNDPFEGKLNDCQLICIGQLLLPHGLLNIPRIPTTATCKLHNSTLVAAQICQSVIAFMVQRS